MPNETKLTTYKGFNDQLQCRGYQFAIGGTYEAEGKVKACGNGFHACEYPLNVFEYYPPAGSRFAVVEQEGDLSREENGDTKVASRRISIKAEISLAGLVRAAIEYTSSRCTPIDLTSPASATGDQGAASATGRYGAASATGRYGRARGSEGSALFLVFRDPNGEVSDQTYGRIIHARAFIVGQDGVKPDTWYSLDAEGELTEVK